MASYPSFKFCFFESLAVGVKILDLNNDYVDP